MKLQTVGKHTFLALCIHAIAIVFLSYPCESSATSAAAVSASPAYPDGEKVSLIGGIKDSVFRFFGGIKEMHADHRRCQRIRGKRGAYRAVLKEQWQLEGMTKQEISKRLEVDQGGITYDEFVMLAKGREDRGRMFQIGYLMMVIPRFLPTALILFPDLLPTPMRPPPRYTGETKMQELSRKLSHATINTLLDLEKQAKSLPLLARLNLPGQTRQLKKAGEIDNFVKATAEFMLDPRYREASGAQLVFDKLDHLLYNKDAFSRDEECLVKVPKPLVQGLLKPIRKTVLLSAIVPHCFKRKRLIDHIKLVKESDNFLVSQKVDLEGLSTARLVEACSDRCISGHGKSEKDLREGLSNWLDVAVVNPANRTLETGLFFNDNLARTILMSYHSLLCTTDHRSTSYLPRLLFQGSTEEAAAAEASSRKSIMHRLRK